MERIILISSREDKTFPEDKKNSEDLAENQLSGIILKDRLVYSVKRMLEAQEVLARVRSDQKRIRGENSISDLKLAEAKVSFNYHRNELGKLLKQRETALSLA
jgi:hypothetical protein